MSVPLQPQRYIVEHETRYAYTAPVSQSWQLARLTPRVLPWQKLLSHSLKIDPPADERRDELDSYGNTVTHFGLHGAHRVLRVRMDCLVEVTERPSVVAGSLSTHAGPSQMQVQMQGTGMAQLEMHQGQFQGQSQGQYQNFAQGQSQRQSLRFVQPLKSSLLAALLKMHNHLSC